MQATNWGCYCKASTEINYMESIIIDEGKCKRIEKTHLSIKNIKMSFEKINTKSSLSFTCFDEC